MYGREQIAANAISYVAYSTPGQIAHYISQPAYLYTAADYLAAFQSLLPRGRVWPRASEATITAVVLGLVQTYARNTIRANNLIAEAFPTTTYELLPEWESTLGISSSATGAPLTAQQRRAQVLARLCGIGGQSVKYITAYAKNLGYLITITQYAPARAGGLRAGGAVCGSPWAMVWTVNAEGTTLIQARAGRLRAGEPLAAWGDSVLQSELQKIAPAHTTLRFIFT